MCRIEVHTLQPLEIYRPKEMSSQIFFYSNNTAYIVTDDTNLPVIAGNRPIWSCSDRHSTHSPPYMCCNVIAGQLKIEGRYTVGPECVNFEGRCTEGLGSNQ